MNLTDATGLEPEYQTIVQEARWACLEVPGARDRLHSGLVGTGEWTPSAASALIELAERYGSFMLRNALALAVAMEIEDGSEGY